MAQRLESYVTQKIFRCFETASFTMEAFLSSQIEGENLAKNIKGDNLLMSFLADYENNPSMFMN